MRFATGRVTAGKVYLPVRLRAALAYEGRCWAPLETGGMLVGYRASDDINGVVVVTDTIPAGPDSVHSRGRFVPDGAWQQQRLEELYERSGRVATYLGDWHTHPDGRLRPSRTDRFTYRRVAHDPSSRTPYPLMLIFALRRDRYSVGAFLLEGDRARRIGIEAYVPRRDGEWMVD